MKGGILFNDRRFVDRGNIIAAPTVNSGCSQHLAHEERAIVEFTSTS